ncbi:MAG: hypothetical protein WA794_16450 [Trebonia sp.]
MTSIAITSVTHPAPFNANFYVVAATVIPVLLLAIGLQSSSQAELLKTVKRKKRDPARFTLGWLAMVWMSIGFMAMAGGIIAEILSVVYLYNQRAPFAPVSVLVEVVFMTVVTGVGAFIAWFLRTAKPLLAAFESWLDRNDVEPEVTAGGARWVEMAKAEQERQREAGESGGSPA